MLTRRFAQNTNSRENPASHARWSPKILSNGRAASLQMSCLRIFPNGAH